MADNSDVRTLRAPVDKIFAEVNTLVKELSAKQEKFCSVYDSCYDEIMCKVDKLVLENAKLKAALTDDTDNAVLKAE